MIQDEPEYRRAVERLSGENRRMIEQRSRLRDGGTTDAEAQRLTDPMASFHLQLVEEVESYEQLRRGEFSAMHGVREIGRLLVAARIAQDVSQRRLAELLGVSESQVSRDERNEYHGVSIERAARILDVLNIDFVGHAELKRPVPA